MDVDEEPKKRPFDETLESARLFDEISKSAGKQPASLGRGQNASGTRGDGPIKSTKSISEKPAHAGEKSGAEAVSSAEAEAAKAGSGSEKATPAATRKPGEPSIGELFSGLVKMSPPDKIRLEKGSIGSLFEKHIGKRA
jgi:hypothetical protein